MIVPKVSVESLAAAPPLPLLGQQRFPLSIREWARSDRFSSVAAPDSIWAMQAASGDIPERVGGVDTFRAFGTPVYRQAGTDGRFAVQIDGGEGFDVADTSRYDLTTTGAISVLTHLFIPPLAGNMAWVGKRGAGAYYQSFINSGTGFVSWLVNDGTSTVGPDINVDHRNRWTTFLFVIDLDNEIAALHSDLGSGSESTAALGSLTNAASFTLGTVIGGQDPENGSLFGYTAAWNLALDATDYAAIIGAIR